MFNNVQGEDAITRIIRRTELHRRQAERRRMKLADRETCLSHIRERDYPTTLRVRTMHRTALAYGGRLPVPTRKDLAEAREREIQRHREMVASRSPLKDGLKYIYDHFVPDFGLIFPGSSEKTGPSSPRTPTRPTRKSYATPGAFPGMGLDSDSEDARSQAGGLDEDVVMGDDVCDDDRSRPSPPCSSPAPGSSADTKASSSPGNCESSPPSAKDDPFSREYIPSKPTFVKPPKEASSSKKSACFTGESARSSSLAHSPSTPRSASRFDSISDASPSTPRPRDSTSAKKQRYSKGNGFGRVEIASDDDEDAVDDDWMSDKIYSPPSTPYSVPRIGSSCSGTPSPFSTPSSRMSASTSSDYSELPYLEDLRSRPRLFARTPKCSNGDKKRTRCEYDDSAGIDDSPSTPRAAPPFASPFDFPSSSFSDTNASHTPTASSKRSKRSSQKRTKSKPASTKPTSKGKQSASSATGRKGNKGAGSDATSEFREREATESSREQIEEAIMRGYDETLIRFGYTKEQRDLFFARLERWRRWKEGSKRITEECRASSFNGAEDAEGARKKRRTEEQASKAGDEDQEDQLSGRLRREELLSRIGSRYHDMKKNSKSLRFYFQWYESGWALINSVDSSSSSSSSSSPLGFADVPWPIFPFPKSAEEVTTDGIKAFMQGTHVKEGLGMRVAAKRELLNWHPDKFATRVLGRVGDDSEREVVKSAADIVQKTLTELVRNPEGSSS